MSELDGKKAVVAGASRGLARGVAGSLSVAGASVYAIARDRAGLEEPKAWDQSIEVAVADATDPQSRRERDRFAGARARGRTRSW